MRKVLVLFAHPKFEHSDANQALIRAVSGLDNVEIRDLYELYPEFNINVQAEQGKLFEHEVIIWQHPFYWYSCPPLLKQWIDLVLEFGWAYGPGGVFLKNKYLMSAITTGGSESAYTREGHNHYTIPELLRPFEQTGRLCGMHYLAPFQVAETHKITPEDLREKANEYRDLILQLRDQEDITPLIPSY